MKRAVFLFFLLFYGLTSLASHDLGGEITYEYIGGQTGIQHHYEVTLVLFRNKPGKQMNSTQSIGVSSSCFSQQTLTVNRIVPPPAQNAGDGGFKLNWSNECVDTNHINHLPVSVHRYTGTIVLPGPCSDFTFWIMRCCRHGDISNIQNSIASQIYLSAKLNSSLGPNSSAVFKVDPLVDVCRLGKVYLQYGAADRDGDSLFYEMMAPATSATTTAIYDSGYSQQNPIRTINGVHLNQRTGLMTFIPNQVEKDVLAVKVDQYTYNTSLGIWLLNGSIQRETVLSILPNCKQDSIYWPVTTSNIDTSAIANCNDTVITLFPPHELKVSSIAPDGSNFRVINKTQSILVPVLRAEVDSLTYGGLFTREIRLHLFNPITTNDTLELQIKPGLNGLYPETSCGSEFSLNQKFDVVVGNCSGVFDVQERSIPANLKIYPNPITDFATITSDAAAKGIREVTLSDVTGKVVLKAYFDGKVGQKTLIDCSKLKAGVYFANVLTEDGHHQTISIVKN